MKTWGFISGGVTSIEWGDNCPVDYADKKFANILPDVVPDPNNPSQSVSANLRFANHPASTVATKCEEKEHGYKFFSGYRATERFGVELGYMAADGFKADTARAIVLDANNFGYGSGPLTSETDASLFYAAVLGYYPLFENASVFGKVGVHKWEMDSVVNFDSSDNYFDRSNVRIKDDGTGVLGGVGAQYDFADLPLSLRGELNHAQLKKGDKLQIFTLSLILRGL